MKKSVFIILAVMVLCACSKDSGNGSKNGNDNPRKYISMTGNYNNLSVVNSDFAFNLFNVLNENVGENKTPLLLSPISVSFTLGMLNNGAANETRDEFLSLLGGGCADIDEMNNFYHDLVSELPTLDNTSKLKIANSQWSVPTFALLPEYSSAINDYFNAETYNLNISTAVSDINNWCSDKTEGLINNFYTEISPDVQTILLNALYFKGIWKNKFDKKDTREDLFTNFDGSESEVSYMNASIYTSCYDGGNYSALTLFFGNNAFCMQIVLPDEDVSLSDCVASLNTDDWLDWYNGGYPRDYDVLLPKFSVNYSGSLMGALGQMGLTSMLDGGDFSNMSLSDSCIDEIKQATVFSIDEDGVEATVVTGNDMATSPGPQETGEFHVTRPFLYIIKENSSNTILFIGRITNL